MKNMHKTNNSILFSFKANQNVDFHVWFVFFSLFCPIYSTILALYFSVMMYS